jgi:hypothetical protein
VSAITNCADDDAEAAIAESEHGAAFTQRQTETFGQALQECSAGLEAKACLQSTKIGDVDKQQRERALCAPNGAG